MAYIDLAQSARHEIAVWRRRLERRLERQRLVVASAVVCAFTSPAAAATAVQASVRSTDGPTLQLIEEGAERSATFRALVAGINHSDGIVYVERGICAFGHVNSCVLPFIAPTQGHRYPRILVTRDKSRVSHDHVLALIAHELQHAREVIEHPGVIDVATMEEMYRRIGTPLTGRQSGYETSAARAAGDVVLHELLATHTSRRDATHFEGRTP
jgi:hypothetical protein